MNEFTELFLKTEPIDRDECAKAIRDLYRHWKIKEPEVIFVRGTKDFFDTCFSRGVEWLDPDTTGDIAYFVTNRSYGKSSRFKNVLREVINRKMIGKADFSVSLPISHIYRFPLHSELEEILHRLWDNSYAVVYGVKHCYIFERPVEVYHNDLGFHHPDDYAVLFEDGSKIFCYNGVLVEEKHIKDHNSLTLDDISKQNNSSKHLLIDLMGVERYLNLIENLKANIDVKGKFKKFFSFHRMKDEFPNQKIEVEIFRTLVNKELALCLFEKESYGDKYVIWDKDDLVCLLEPEDMFLWELFNLSEAITRGCRKLTISYADGVYSIKSGSSEDVCGKCRHDIVPAWAKCFLLNKENYCYKDEKYSINIENGEIEDVVSAEGKDLNFGQIYNRENWDRTILMPLFSGCDNVPYYMFNIDITSDTWEELLEKWANHSLEWLYMCEDSSRLP